MSIQILMPALSPTMEEGTLTKWHVKEGDEVRSGDIIAEIETDKATMELEAVEEGKIGKLIVAEGTENVPVNDVIAVLLEDGEDASAVEAVAKAPQASAPVSGKSEPVAPAPAAISTSQPLNDPEIPEGTTMRSTTVREALRDAMAEEMRADERVFVMGEEVGQYQGDRKSVV